MTRRGFEKLYTKKFALIFWPLPLRDTDFPRPPLVPLGPSYCRADMCGGGLKIPTKHERELFPRCTCRTSGLTGTSGQVSVEIHRSMADNTNPDKKIGKAIS